MPSGSNRITDTIKRRRADGYSVKAIAKEFNYSEEGVKRVLAGESVECLDSLARQESEVRGVGRRMLKRPNYRIVNKTFNGDLEAYRRCVCMVFGVEWNEKEAKSA